MPCAFFVSTFTQSPLPAVASPANARPWPPRKPFASATIVVPPVRMLSTSIASTPPAVPFHASGASPAPIVGETYCGTRITWKWALPPVVYALTRPPALVPLIASAPPVIASAPFATTYSYAPAVVEVAPLPLPLPSPYDEVLVLLIVAPCICTTSSRSPLAIAVPASPVACAPTVIDVAVAPAFAVPV